jgi:hypothetical protein
VTSREGSWSPIVIGAVAHSREALPNPWKMRPDGMTRGVETRYIPGGRLTLRCSSNAFWMAPLLSRDPVGSAPWERTLTSSGDLAAPELRNPAPPENPAARQNTDRLLIRPVTMCPPALTASSGRRLTFHTDQRRTGKLK